MTARRKFQNIILCIMLIGTLTSPFVFAQINTPPFHIYLNADQTSNANSGKSIELGIRAALDQVNWKLAGFPVELIIKDHRGSTPRSHLHFEQFLKDPQGLLVYGGLHSPPLISDREFINKEKILTLVPWAAASPITRPYSNENWIFRLSLDDSKASSVIINHAVTETGCQKPLLLLEDTSWGIANQLNMKRALNKLDLKAVDTIFFKWGVGFYQAKSILENAISDKADCFILVANAPEGITFAKAMLSLPKEKQKPIRSHWGITGGDFASTIGREGLSQLDLNFIQTRFTFFQQSSSKTRKEALNSLKKLLSEPKFNIENLKAPAGFIHAFDLTRILIAAANQASLSGNITEDRLKIKEALENLNTPIEGLIKTYDKPFQAYSLNNQDAHEALSFNDFVMAKFDKQGNIRLLDIYKVE